MTRLEMLKILQEETDAFDTSTRLRDDVLDAMEKVQKEAINYSRCCESDSEQLKSEIDTEFEKFVEANTNEQKIAPLYWHNDRCFWSRDDLYKWWLKNKQTL